MITLNKMIKKAKSHSWDELIKDLDRDLWGLPYRLVLDKLRRSQPSLTEILDSSVLQSTVEKLFPYDVDYMSGQEAYVDNWDERYNITEAEVFSILRRANTNKAPGSDGIKSIFFKKIPEVTLKKLTNIYNIYMRAGIFPGIWKRAILVLIPKGELDVKAPKVHPICLLNELRKIFEKVIVKNLRMDGRSPDIQTLSQAI